MPDLKISQLPVASATTGAELFPVVQGGVTKQIALNNVQQVGTLTSLAVSGVTTLQAGTAAAPALTTTGDTDTGVFFPTADMVAITTGGTERVRVWSNGDLRLTTASAAYLFASSSGTVSAGIQLDAANTRIDVLTAGTQRWRFTSTGHLVAFADNTYDIGASGATRPRNIFIGGTGTFGGAVSIQGGYGDGLTIVGTPLDTNWMGGIRFQNTGNTISSTILASSVGIRIYYNNVERWQINNQGHWIAGADNTYDIGASGVTRPRTVYAATSVEGGYIRAGAASAGAASTTTIGNGTSTTVGAAGAASALPANPLGYIIAHVGTTQVKIPYYTA